MKIIEILFLIPPVEVDGMLMVNEKVLIAIITLLATVVSTLITTYFVSKIKRKKIESEIRKNHAESDGLVIQNAMKLVFELRTSVDLQKKEIDELRGEVNTLKNLDEKHNLEREELHERVKVLKEENDFLRKTEVKSTKRIDSLNKELDELEKKVKS